MAQGAGWEEYAVDAFERGALDCVLKPFREARLTETVSRLKERLDTNRESAVNAQAVQPDLASVLRQLTTRMGLPPDDFLRWIKANVGQTVRLIPVEDVLYFQSDEKYTRVALEDSEVPIRKSIKELLEELDLTQFWQIHRPTLVNTRAIAGVVRGMRDQADLKLKGRQETLKLAGILRTCSSRCSGSRPAGARN